jgi:hypothetical protein
MVEYLAKLAELTMDNRRRPKKISCAVARQGPATVAAGHGDGRASLRLSTGLGTSTGNPQTQTMPTNTTTKNNGHRLIGNDTTHSID